MRLGGTQAQWSYSGPKERARVSHGMTCTPVTAWAEKGALFFAAYRTPTRGHGMVLDDNYDATGPLGGSTLRTIWDGQHDKLWAHSPPLRAWFYTALLDPSPIPSVPHPKGPPTQRASRTLQAK